MPGSESTTEMAERIRRALGYKQRDLAQQLGVTQSAVSQLLRRGLLAPDSPHREVLGQLTFEAWCSLWNCTDPSYLCSFSEEYPGQLPACALASLRARLGSMNARETDPPVCDVYVRAARFGGASAYCYVDRLKVPTVFLVLLNDAGTAANAAAAECWEDMLYEQVIKTPVVGRAHSFVQEYAPDKPVAPAAEHRPVCLASIGFRPNRSHEFITWIDDVIRNILGTFQQEECAKLFGTSQPTISRRFTSWRSGVCLPDECDLHQLEHLNYLACCRRFGCDQLAPVACYPPATSNSNDWRTRSMLTMREFLFHGAFRKAVHRCDIDLHIRPGRLGPGARAHCFGNHPRGSDVFIVLVSDSLGPADRYRTAWDEVCAHVVPSRANKRRPGSPLIQEYRCGRS